jgi:hypothetical protein
MALQGKIGRSTLIAAGRVAAGQGSGESRAAIRPSGIGETGSSWASVETRKAPRVAVQDRHRRS